MTVQYPLSLQAFIRALRVRSLTFSLGEATTQSGTAEGELLTASRGDALWGGKVVVGLQKDQDQSMALMDLVRQTGATFLMSDPKRKWLKAHPDEALAANIQSLSLADRRVLTLSGLVNGTVLTNGDLISFEYGSNPVRRYLGRIVVGGVVSVSSLEVSVLPFLPLGLSANIPVELHSTSCVAKYVPKSFEPVERLPGFDSGFSFSWRQTKR